MIVSAFVPLCPHAHLFTRMGIPVRYVYDTDKSESKIKRTTKAARKKIYFLLTVNLNHHNHLKIVKCTIFSC